MEVELYSDPGCPWAYSVSPALAVLRWRYGDQLRWRLITVGLTETADQYERRGYTPARVARNYIAFRRFGMPFATEPKARVPATGRACRAIVATRLRFPGREFDVMRALQFGWFTSPLVLDEDDAIATALARVEELDVAAVIAALDDPQVEAAYQGDRDAARSAAGGATELQGKARNTDGRVRFTAPSLVFHDHGTRLEAGGFQTIEAYDVVVANLDPRLDRAAPPADASKALAAFPHGLTTQEVAALLTHGNDAPDRAGAEAELIDLVAAGRGVRTPLADDAIWQLAA